MTEIYLYEHTVINQLLRPPHLEHPRTLDTTYWSLSWSINITIFTWTQSYQSAVETPTLRTSQDTTTHTHMYIYIFIYMNLEWSIDITIYIYIFEHNVINQLWGPPHLEHPKTFDTTYIYIYIMIFWHNYIYMNTKLSISCGDPHT